MNFDEVWSRKSIPDKIAIFVKWFTNITKEERDFISQVLNWDDETRIAFSLAKRIFEEDDS